MLKFQEYYKELMRKCHLLIVNKIQIERMLKIEFNKSYF